MNISFLTNIPIFFPFPTVKNTLIKKYKSIKYIRLFIQIISNREYYIVKIKCTPLLILIRVYLIKSYL